jgi:iron only hydrogenase large subunit-like protein
MSAILSASDLNDFISPGVACIKPIETLPAQEEPTNGYEVTTEDKVAAANPAPAQISLTDCLACSGCVTSAEAVLVSLQSHVEVLSTLEKYSSLAPSWLLVNGNKVSGHGGEDEGRIFVASVSPQVRASLAAVYRCSEVEAGNMIQQLLSGHDGLAAGGAHRSRFLWTIDTNQLRDAALVLAAEEMAATLDGASEVKKPILTSACPGWICYAEKTHPYILPHLSRLKSPQALAGTLLKSVLSRKYGVSPDKVWHLAIMPCFDKKLEASRSELTSNIWSDDAEGVRDVDCVITARELISMAEARGIDFGRLPKTPLPRKQRVRFPDLALDRFLFPSTCRRAHQQKESAAGTSDGYLWHVLRRFQAKHPGSRIKVERGRNADVVEYLVVRHNDNTGKEEAIFKAARFYGFRNIQNLVRRLKPKGQSKLLAAAAARGAGARKIGAATPNGLGGAGGASEYAYIEVMACPGGCTNGGGQVRVGEVEKIRTGDESMEGKNGPNEQRAWLATVDEAYFSASSQDSSADEAASDDEVEMNGHVNGSGVDMDIDEEETDVVDGISRRRIMDVLRHWSEITEVERDKLVFTSYREVESDVGKKKVSDVDRVAGLASSIGGGW